MKRVTCRTIVLTKRGEAMARMSRLSSLAARGHPFSTLGRNVSSAGYIGPLMREARVE